MPTFNVTVGGKTRARLDHTSTLALMQAIASLEPDLAIIEAVSGWSRKKRAGKTSADTDAGGQSASAAFVFGHTTGAQAMALTAAGIPYQQATPQAWKSALGIPADKDAARAAASRLFPTFAYLWPRVKDHGRAEASLLAYYGAHYCGRTF